MGHTVCGFIGRHAELVAAEPFASRSVVVHLHQGLGFMVEPEASVCPSSGIPGEREGYGRRLGGRMPIAYVVTEYFGGEGEQGAALWSTTDSIGYAAAKGNVINMALRLLGVERIGRCDEFDSVGLSRYRSNENWIEFGTVGRASYEREAKSWLDWESSLRS